MQGGLASMGLGAPGNATATFAASAVDTSTASGFTFTNHNIGTASADRFVVVSVSCTGNAATYNISSVTIGGNTAAILYDPGSTVASSAATALYGLRVPTGTTGTVVVTYNVSVATCAIGSWACTNVGTVTPIATYNASPSSGTTGTLSSVAVPPGGIFIASAALLGGSAGTYTWTGGPTESFDQTISGVRTHSGAAWAPTTNQTGASVVATYTQTITTLSKICGVTLR